MFRVLKHIIVTVLLLGLVSCADDNIFSGLFDSEQPVEFMFTLPDAMATRSIDNPKTEFVDGDVIHIEGEFTVKKNGSDETETIVRYGALAYDKENNKWKEEAGSGLKWPNLATKGKFKAYYIAKEDKQYEGGVLQAGAQAIEIPLSSLKTNGDPLMAETANEVSYGHAVPLTFRHLCTYLTLNSLEPVVANEYWFTKGDKDVKETDSDFNNGFSLALGTDNKLEFKFCKILTNNLVYIAGEYKNVVNNEGMNIAQTKYFLEPGLYEKFKLWYQTSDEGYYEYLSYDYNKISNDENGENKPDFKAGIPYTLDISKSPGVTISTPKDGDEDWEDDDSNFYTVDVEQFLRAAAKSEAYTSSENVPILEKTATGVRLLKNVDFKFEKYDVFSGDFLPTITGGQTFDGDHHYISNLGSPLFYSNSGTIKNLGIKVIKIENIVSDEAATSEKNQGKTYDMSRIGGLCRRNMDTGVITDVRIEGGVTITAQVKTHKDGSKDENGNTQGNEAHNIGGVAGSNIGKIEDVELSGSFAVEVSNHTEAKADLFAQINIGGIVGQNGANGVVSGIKPLADDLSVSVANKCSGELAAFYVGGIVGSNSGYLSDIIVPNLKIDGTQSMGLASYLGGVAGDLSANAPTGSVYAASVSSCIVSGEVKGGKVNPKGDLTCAMLAGGIAGATLHTPVTDCSVAVSVDNSYVDLSAAGIICATGGAFGRIRKEGSDIPPIKDIIAYGDELKGATTVSGGSTSYIGNFAGLVHTSMDWDSDFADKNVIVKSHSGVSGMIGDKLD